MANEIGQIPFGSNCLLGLQVLDFDGSDRTQKAIVSTQLYGMLSLSDDRQGIVVQTQIVVLGFLNSTQTLDKSSVYARGGEVHILRGVQPYYCQQRGSQ